MQKNDALKNPEKIPGKTGVYIFRGQASRPLYVGKAINLQKRLASYLIDPENRSHLGKKTRNLLERTVRIDWILVDSEIEALLLEANLIKEHQPEFNTILKDDKSFLYIRITKEDYPHVEAARLPKEKRLRTQAERGADYYGPFPSGRIVRKTLKILRPIFPYCSAKKIDGKKPCFYFGIDLCIGPCAGTASKIQYQRMVRRLKLLLSGKKIELIRQMKTEMAKLARAQQFEEAAQIRNQIENINYLSSQYRMPEEYLKNPLLVDDLRRKEISDLKSDLKLIFPDLKKIRRIEAYDISNIQGKDATGSMVVFKNGEPLKSEYRRFRIRRENSPNDYEMMKEVLDRRFKNDWEKPDLILIDGGKGQLSAALEVRDQHSLKIPIIGLAKRLEEVIVPANNTSGTDPGVPFKVLRLGQNSQALNLLIRLRDESHRFALAYHRKLRFKSFFEESGSNPK